MSGNISLYQITFKTHGSVVATKSVKSTRCTAGRCNDTFELRELPSNPHSSYDNVSVAAENVVGEGAARTCTTQIISESNFVITCAHKPLVHLLQINNIACSLSF